MWNTTQPRRGNTALPLWLWLNTVDFQYEFWQTETLVKWMQNLWWKFTVLFDSSGFSFLWFVSFLLPEQFKRKEMNIINKHNRNNKKDYCCTQKNLRSWTHQTKALISKTTLQDDREIIGLLLCKEFILIIFPLRGETKRTNKKWVA